MTTSGTPAPDFSGHWRLDRDASRFGLAGLDELTSMEAEIVHTRLAFRMNRTLVRGTEHHSIEFAVPLDGAEHHLADPERVLNAAAHWEGNALVIRTRIAGAQGEAINEVAYRLDDGGMRLSAHESFDGPGLRYTNHWVLSRVSG